MNRSDVEAFLHRDWASVERLKSDFWCERKKRLTPEEIFRIGDELRALARELRPGWPSEQERQEDLEVHVRVAAALRSVR